MATKDLASPAPPSTDPRLQPDDFAQAGTVTHFPGYIGRASSPEKTRLYLTLGFDTYIEVASSDILRSVTVPDPEKPVPQTHLWIRASAFISHAAIDSFAGSADFVKGEIFSSCSPGAFPVDLSQQITQQEAARMIGLSWFRNCHESGRHSRRICLCCDRL